ncbi:hypothetical protein PInf_018907 [Phytophthora infestans]|nr:hypothetical protein PInf_018907 [Phytophthora infestans]
MTVFDPERAVDEELAWQKAGRVNNTDPKTVTEPVSAELSWEDDECSSARDPMDTLRLHYYAIAATEDDQEGDVDDSKTDIFERSGTDLDLTDYAHGLAFLADLAKVESTELDYGAPNIKSSSHTPARSARLVAKARRNNDLKW